MADDGRGKQLDAIVNDGGVFIRVADVVRDNHALRLVLLVCEIAIIALTALTMVPYWSEFHRAMLWLGTAALLVAAATNLGYWLHWLDRERMI